MVSILDSKVHGYRFETCFTVSIIFIAAVVKTIISDTNGSNIHRFSTTELVRNLPNCKS